jgi:formamidopyrimidine-DNA glycosylase
VLGRAIWKITVAKPFVLRSVDPPISAFVGRRIERISLLGKRIVFDTGDAHYLVIHLMVAGRFQWHATAPKLGAKLSLAAFEFETGALVLTEAGTTRRASITCVRGDDALRALDRGGLDVMTATLAQFAARVRSENHTIKRTLTDPRLFSGIGNAYSDEILHAARLSPLLLTKKISDAEIATLFDATRATLAVWIDRLRADFAGDFPKKVTAFRPEMAVHGKFGEGCPDCGYPVQRIRYADNETNYCAKCQTGGRRLADRALSRLLGEDYPRELEDD